MAIFRGAGVALITPMHEDGSVNYEKLTEILEEQIAGGTDAIISCGTTGEAATLSEAEHMDVIRHSVRVTAHRIPVIAGTGSNSTETAGGGRRGRTSPRDTLLQQGDAGRAL